MSVPKLTLNDGNTMPMFGLGTWKSKPGEVVQAVKDAIDLGYRHIDCAHVYGNEKEVGAAISDRIAAGVIKREDLFVTSKLWCTHHLPDLVEPALMVTLNNLDLQYLDLYLIHWPFAFEEGDQLFPPDLDGGILTTNVDYLDTWKAMEAVRNKGLTRSIGISNFNRTQIERLLQNSRIAPAMNQIECHPYLNQNKLIDFCKSKNIQITGYSPFGSPDRPWAKPDEVRLLDDPKVKEIADLHSKSPAQILLRYQIDKGIVAIPKSVTKNRIEENSKIWDFRLSEEELKLLDSLDRKTRCCPFTEVTNHIYYPFHDEY